MDSNPQQQPTQFSNMKIDTSIYRDHLKQKYKGVINAIDPSNTESKVLIIDPALSDIIRYLLTKEEIGTTQLIFLKEQIKVDTKNIVFLITPSVQNINKMSSVIKMNTDK